MNDLGDLVGTAREPASKLIVIAGALVVLCSLPMMLLSADMGHEPARKLMTSWGIAAFILAVGALIIWYGVTRGRRLRVYQQGVSFGRASVRWSELTRVTTDLPADDSASAAVVGFLGQAMTELARDEAAGLQLGDAKGRTVVIPRSFFVRAHALLDGAQRTAVARGVENARAALARGEPYQGYSGVELTATHLVADGQTIPLADVARLEDKPFALILALRCDLVLKELLAQRGPALPR